MEKFRFGLAGEKLYSFTWRELADWYVEVSKIQNNKNTYELLADVYKLLLKLLHPFTPFVTEKIWEYFKPNNLLIITKWPEIDDKKIDIKSEQDFELIKELIIGIRSWRKENKKEPKEVLKIKIVGAEELVKQQKEIINKLAKVELESLKKLSSKDFEIKNLSIKVG